LRTPSPKSPHRRSPDQLDPAQPYATGTVDRHHLSSRSPKVAQTPNNRSLFTGRAAMAAVGQAIDLWGSSSLAGGEPTHTPDRTPPPVSSQRSATLPNTTGTGGLSETDSDAETTSRTPRRPFTDRARRAALARKSGDRPTQEESGDDFLYLQRTIQDLWQSIDELKRDQAHHKASTDSAGIIEDLREEIEEDLREEIEEEKKNFSDELYRIEDKLRNDISSLEEYIQDLLRNMPEDRREEATKEIEALKDEIAELNRKVAKQDNADPSDSPPPPSNESEVDKNISEIAAAIGGIKYDQASNRFVPDTNATRTGVLTYKKKYDSAIFKLQHECNSSQYQALSERLIEYAINISQSNPSNMDKEELEFFSKLLDPERKTNINNKVEISFKNNFQRIKNANLLAIYLAKWNREDFNEYITKYSNQPAHEEWKDNKDKLENFIQDNSDLKAKQANNNVRREELGAGKAKNNIGMSFSSFIGLASLITGIALAVIFQNPYLLFITSGTIISTIGYFACSSNYDKYQKEDKKLNQENREITDKITKNSEEIKLLNDQLNGKETRGTTKNTRVKGIEMG